ncbi:MAG: hypothetical protein KZQ77_02905, partial [Candidatus Thiodiazotropha sp. (ex Notomyrtea botanica)]|nr:hypothetical protein [Candidatus Thiodiazotropha sp. (ex Notomyrtea botanica)]
VNSCVAAVEDESKHLHHAGLHSLIKGLNQLIDHLQDPSLQMDHEHATSHLTHLISIWESSSQAS